jgi:hypothetical protein
LLPGATLMPCGRRAQERDALEPAYMAKAQAEMFEVKQARAEGATAAEARARAEAAGALAFETATQDVSSSRAAQDAYEARQEEKRAAAAARAAVAQAAGSGDAAAPQAP